MARETGTVKWFNESKGFGFIAPDNGGKDLFAHFKEIEGSGRRPLLRGHECLGGFTDRGTDHRVFEPMPQYRFQLFRPRQHRGATAGDELP